MISVRKSDERGKADIGWLNARHSFSFGQYYDAQHMGYGPLRVINEDHIAAGAGFGTHPHENMEIITYVLDGALEHKDSLGSGSVMRHGDVQRMSAGTGIHHSEFNHSKDNEVHLLQIWILPERTGLPPSYEQKTFSTAGKQNILKLIVSYDGRNGSLKIHQQADIYSAKLKNGADVEFEPKVNRKIWLQVARGSLTVNGELLHPGDGAAIEGEKSLVFASNDAAEFLLFDMA